MSPEELYRQAGIILDHCDTSHVTQETAEAFINSLQSQIRSINEWLTPANGTVGYGDAHLTNLLQQLKYQAESVLKNFPNGTSSLAVSLTNFRQYLQDHYNIHIEELPKASNG